MREKGMESENGEKSVKSVNGATFRIAEGEQGQDAV
jgi:hypothetical protein